MGGYDQLTLEERYMLFRLHKAGMAVGQMADRLGPHRLTIYRELGRNRAWCLRSSKIEYRSQLGDHVRDQHAMGWSPEPR